MKLLIIGKYGQVATALQQQKQHKIYAFSKDELNVKDTKTIESKINQIKPDAVINTSAYVRLPDCEENPLEAFQINAIANFEIANVCKKYGVLYIAYSTDYVFDGKKITPYTENDETNPLQIYGISKLAGEHAIRSSYSDGGYIIRTSGVFGGGKMGSSIKKSNFVLNVLDQATRKDIVEVSSVAFVSPTYAMDLADATVQILEKHAKPAIYHLTNTGYCTWTDLAKEILKIIKVDKPLKKHKIAVKENFKRPEYSVLKNTKAKALGIYLPSWKDGLARYIHNELL